MNRLQMATLLSWADDAGLRGRKRLQKVVFFLQEAGCPLDCRYTLHHYGPYSRDVADRCDEMVAAGLIDESGGPSTGDMQYAYARCRAIFLMESGSAMDILCGLNIIGCGRMLTLVRGMVRGTPYGGADVIRAH